MRLPDVPRGRPRLGLGGALVVFGIVGLIAAGFGMLGGRPTASPSPPVGGVAPSQVAPSQVAPSPAVAPTPQITPYSECASAPTTRPEVQLQVDGRRTPGFVEILQWLNGPPPGSDPSPAFQEPPERVNIPVDAIAELWVVGGACAHGWNIGLIGNDVLNAFLNPALDPAIAAQNRFALTLAPFSGRDLELRADLFFPTLIARAMWPIHVEPLEWPVPALQHAQSASIVEGCDVERTLGNGYAYPGDPSCTDDLPFGPGITIAVDRGERLQFGLGDWDVSNAALACGRLSGTSFIAEPEPGCFLEAGGRSSPSTHVTFPELPADLEAGLWTLAISACAFDPRSNRICGTWYANVRIRS